MNLLQGKVAVITGGTRGLGFGIARAYADEGAAVVVASRSVSSVDSAVQQLAARGAKASGFALDVSDLSQMEALADHAVKTFGRIDIWINNAGVAGPYGPTLDFKPDVFVQVVETNIIGVYNGSRVAMRRFLAQGSGKLINLLGHGYKGPVPWQNAYSSSKAWVRSFTSSLAVETKGQGVGVYAFNPGMVLTDLLTDVDVIEGSEPLLNRFPLVVRMLAKPVEVPAKKAVWLASPATDGKTGLLISSSSNGQVVVDALKEGLRAILRRPVPPTPVRMRTIAPDR